jgi:hypothetical protein
MYLVQGGDLFVGSHFFFKHVAPRTKRELLLFGATDPQLVCASEFWEFHRPLLILGEWGYTDKYAPTPFSIDTSISNHAVNYLTGGTKDFLSGVGEILDGLASEFGHDAQHKGYRYWLWNLVATRTLSLLEEQDLVPGKGNGQFRIETARDYK